MKTAIVIGATGLVGNELVKLLIQDPYFERIVLFTRRNSNQKHRKLEEHLIDFDRTATWAHLVQGDVLFSALGTTIQQAGSKEAQYKIDFTYQYQFAKTAAANGVSTYVLVSSLGANPKAIFFYSRMKGQLEEAIKKLHFNAIHIIRPSILVGQRQKSRFGEQMASTLLTLFNRIGLLKRYQPIRAEKVAHIMIQVSKSPMQGIHIHTTDTR